MFDGVREHRSDHVLLYCTELEELRGGLFRAARMAAVDDD